MAEHLSEFLRIGDICTMFKISRSTVYKFIQEGNFPKPTKIGRNSRWNERKIHQFIEGLKEYPFFRAKIENESCPSSPSEATSSEEPSSGADSSEEPSSESTSPKPRLS